MPTRLRSKGIVLDVGRGRSFFLVSARFLPLFDRFHLGAGGQDGAVEIAQEHVEKGSLLRGETVEHRTYLVGPGDGRAPHHPRAGAGVPRMSLARAAAR